MTTEVYINGMEIDIDQGTVVAATYTGLDFGKLGKRSGAKTNSWTAPFSARNKLIFEGAEIVGSWSAVPYRRATIIVDVEGVTVFEGWSVLEQSSDGYEIVSFAGASDFYSIISSTSLREIDLSQFDHVWNEVVVRNSLSNIDGFIYAFVEYGKEWNADRIPVDDLRPQIFLKDVIAAVVSYAGYTIEGAVLTEARFQNHVIIPTEFPAPFVLGDTVDLTRWLPNVLQSKVWLDFVNIYGLQIQVNDFTKEIRATYVDDLLFNEAEDWTAKVDESEDHVVNYRFPTWGQTSYLKYKDYTLQNTVRPSYPKEIYVDDEFLKEEADIYKSDFTLIQNNSSAVVWTTETYLAKKGFSGIWNSATTYVFNGEEGTVVWYQGTYYKSLATSSNKVPPAEPAFWEAIAEKEVWDVAPRPTYGILVSDPSFYVNVAYSTGDELITKKITNQGLKWDEIYPEKYRILDQIRQRTKIVEKLIKLNYADVNQLDFTRPKYIDNELYLVQEIKQFKLNEVDSTLVVLVRI